MRNNKPKILIVDDEKSFTKLTRLALTQYEVREVNDPKRVLETAREFQPDLILLDVVMPEFDGGDVAAQLRDDPVLKQIRVVFLTAIVSEKETDKRSLFGGYPFIAKPVTAEKLAENIEKYLAA
ncbi:MAG TPA: response regulator [Chthoniobacterales bacterium]